MISVESGDVLDPLSVSAAKKQEDCEGEFEVQPESTAITLDLGSGGASGSDKDGEESGIDTFASYGQLVGPPSYEENMMYDMVVKAGGDSESNAEEEGPPLQISITDPQRREQQNVLGINSGYMQYKVTTVSKLPSYKSKEVTVRRRFREFVSLSDVLKARFRGYFIPPRPEKNAVEGQRMKESFIEERRLALEKYLSRLTAHPAIGRSEELQVFLETEGELGASLQWQMLQPVQPNFLEGTARFSKQIFGRESHVPMPTEIAQPSKKTNDVLRRMREGMQSMKMEWGGVSEHDHDEKNLKKQTKALEGMWDQLSNASRMAETLVKKFERMGAVLGDLGLSFIKLSKYEEIEGTERAKFTDTVSCAQSTSQDTKQTGIALVRLARLARKVTGKMAQDLGELHDYLYFMPAVQKALAAREQALLTLNTLETQKLARTRAVDDLEQEGTKTLGGDRGKLKKATDLKGELNTLENTIIAAQAEYEKVKSVNFQELERFKERKRTDFTAMLHSLACVQAAYAERSAEVWLSVAKELGASDEQIAEVRNPPRRTGMRFE